MKHTTISIDELMNLSDVEKLRYTIKLASQAYYEGDSPIISDEAFDRLVAKLSRVSPGDPLLKEVATGYVPSGHLERVKHDLEVGSLDKCKSSEFEIFPSLGKIVVATPKMDGISAVAYYNYQGVLEYVVSRGGGSVGLDITRNLLPGKTIPTRIDKSIRSVRGEIILTIQAFSRVGGSLPRNKASGLCNSVNAIESELIDLKFVSFSIFNRRGSHNNGLTKTQEIEMLRNLGFVVSPYLEISQNDLRTEIQSGSLTPDTLASLDGETIPYDGIVISDNLERIQGMSRESLAIKFPNKESDTKVLDIEWSLSRTGRLVPVLILEPVLLSGATITRCTANNAEYVRNLQCGKDSIVSVVRANEVIPYITKTVSPSRVVIPTHCPVCCSELKEKGVDLCCENPNCSSKMSHSARRFLSYGLEKSLSFGILAKLIDRFCLDEGFDQIKRFLEYVDDNIIYGMYSDVTAKKVNRFVKRLKEFVPTIYDVLYIANIQGLGDASMTAMSNAIATENFVQAIRSGSIPAVWSNYCSNYVAFNGIKSNNSKIRDIMSFFDWNLKSVEPVKKSCNVRFLVTGKVSSKSTRKEFVDYVSRFGCYEASSVSSADVCICNAISNSSKIKESKSRGIPIITEEEFLRRYCQ